MKKMPDMCNYNMRLPTDLTNVIISYLWCIDVFELFDDIQFYSNWQQTVPEMFLSPSLLHKKFYYAVANPMIRTYPYTPRRFLHMHAADIWSATLPALVNMICAEKIRDIKTYKGCIQRWTRQCVCNSEVYLYRFLCRKVLIKLHESHFRRAFPVFFVREALRQTRSLYASALEVSLLL